MPTSKDLKELTLQVLSEIRAVREENQAQARQIRRLEVLMRAKGKKSGEMLCLNEAAALLGLAPKTARNWRSDKKFPEPDRYTRNGGRKRPLWFMDTIEAFRKSLEKGH